MYIFSNTTMGFIQLTKFCVLLLVRFSCITYNYLSRIQLTQLSCLGGLVGSVLNWNPGVHVFKSRLSIINHPALDGYYFFLSYTCMCVLYTLQAERRR